MASIQGRIGEQIGEYRLLRYLGCGSFSVVYLAEQIHDHTLAAVKLLHTPLTASNGWRAFLNEARSIRLQHPHILPLLDFGTDQEETPFLVMEYAAGGTLRKRYPRGRQVPLPIIALYTMQLASALQYAHDRHLIHRDVKPENMLLRADGTILLSDFGLARIIGQSSTLSQPTQAGTPAYMAPEQGKGHPRPASDQYALAVTVYEWISGRRPFLGTAIEVAVQHQLEPPPPLRTLCPQMSEHLEQVLARALAKRPEERFETVLDFAQELQQAIEEMQAENRSTQRTVPFVSADDIVSAGHVPSTPAAHVAEASAVANTRTSVFSIVQPLPTSQQSHVLRRRRGGPFSRIPIYWRVSALLLILGLLIGGGWLYTVIRGPARSSRTPNPSPPQITGTGISVGGMPASASPTPLATATATSAGRTPTAGSNAPQPSVPAGWHKVLDDPLTASQHGADWSTSAGCIFRADDYEQISTGLGYCAYGDSATAATVFGDLYYSVDLSIHQGNQAGIIVRNQHNNYYYFSVTTGGAYALSIHQASNGGQDTTISRGNSTAIRQGQNQWNILTLIARGNSLALFINSKYVGTTTDATYNQGIVGVALNGPGPQNVSGDAFYKNAVVWVP